MNSISPALPFLLPYASVRRPRRLARYQSPLPNDFAPRAKHTLLTLRESPAAVHSSRFHRAQCQGPRQTAPRGRDGSHIYHRKDLRLLLRPCFPKACGAILVSDTFDNEHQRNGECCEIRGTGSLPTNTTVPLITGHPIRVGEWDAAWGDAVVVCYEDHQLTVPMKAASTWEPPEHRFQKRSLKTSSKFQFLNEGKLKFQTHLDLSLGAFRDESLMNFRILIFVVDLCSACGFDFQGFHQVFHLVRESPRLQSKIAGGFFSGIELLVNPFCRRHEHRAGPPVDTSARFPRLPQ